MTAVTYFKQYLSKKLPENTREHFTIYNYLRYFCHDGQILTADLFTRFYRKALLFPYWQQNLPALEKTLQKELKAFQKFYYSTEYEPEELALSEKWQIVALQKEKDIIDMVSSYLQNHSSKGDRIQVFPLERERVLALILKRDGHLNVFSFSSLAVISKGKLEPLSPLSELYYSRQYELKSAYSHILEDGHLNFIHFKIKEQKVTAYQCQNSCFQKSYQFKQKNLTEINKIFHLLKKIESFFIQSKSDPHYKNLIESLHNHYRKLLLSPVDNSLETAQILSEAKNALQNLYPHDHLLFLLTANIDFHFRNKQAKPDEKQS